ncbi:MAG: hypothetical protein ACRD88_12050, partial [Terriglobia bacterium]
MKHPRILLTAFLMWGAVGIASADVLTLKSGEAVTGKYEGGDQATVQFSVNGVLQRYPVADVTNITFAPVPIARTAPTSAPTYSSGRTAPGPQPSTTDQPPVLRRTAPPATTSGSATTTTSTAPPPPRPASITIPGGTEITVRMIDPV